MKWFYTFEWCIECHISAQTCLNIFPTCLCMSTVIHCDTRRHTLKLLALSCVCNVPWYGRSVLWAHPLFGILLLLFSPHQQYFTTLTWCVCVCVAAILFEFRSFCLCIGSTLHCSQNKTKQRRYSASCKHIAEKKTFLFVSHSNFCQQNEHAHFCTFIMSVQHLQWNNFWLQTKFIRYQIGNARMLICPWKNRH